MISLAEIYDAARAGDAQLLRTYLRKGICPDTPNIRVKRSLWIAADGGHKKVVELRLEMAMIDFR